MRAAISRIFRGLGSALRARIGVLIAVATAVLAFELLLPPALLSVARKPFDYFAFNAWLPELPSYLASSTIAWQRKLEFLPNLALFWITADSPYGGVDWGFAVTVSDLVRYVLLALLFGLYFALVFHREEQATVMGSRIRHGGGASGALASVLGVSSGGCTVVGCGAPVLPVVGLAFAGLSSGTLALLAELSRVVTVFLFVAMTAGALYLAWRAGNPAAMTNRP